jgi:hypothetical protein
MTKSGMMRKTMTPAQAMMTLLLLIQILPARESAKKTTSVFTGKNAWMVVARGFAICHVQALRSARPIKIASRAVA